MFLYSIYDVRKSLLVFLLITVLMAEPFSLRKLMMSGLNLYLQVYFAGVGHIKNIRAALRRGKQLKCSRCARPGATIGCRIERCPRTYHLVG